MTIHSTNPPLHRKSIYGSAPLPRANNNLPTTTSLIFSKPSTTKLLIFLISMATFFSLFLLFSISPSLPFSASSTHHHHRSSPITPPDPSSALSPAAPEIMQACNATRFPDACRSTLSQSTDLPRSPNPLQIIQSAFRASAENMNAAQSMIQSILSSPSENTNRSNAARICLDILTYSEHRTADAASAIWRGRTKDARAWASAALAYQYDCWSGLKYVNDTQAVNQTMSFLDNQTMSFLDTTLIVSTSNALSMTVAFDLYGNNTGLWGPPKTERDGFWESTESVSGVGGLGLSGGFPSGMAANATVCKDGGGCYDTVQAAVSAAPTGLVGSEKFVIYIKEGVYEEIVRVPYEKKNLVLVGDGMGKSVITGSLSTGLLGITTYNTATFGVAGDGFMAYGLTFENTAGPDAHQAVVFRSESDLSYIENCEFLGNQDTLYAHSLRQLYKSCRIQGNVDFIFGNSATIFQNCTILVCPRQVNPEKGETNTITAHGRTDPAQWTGFAFLGCIVNGTDEFAELYHSKPSVHKNYLGRPWKLYSRTVFINCSLGDVIAPAGWLPWSGDFALSTLYYGEYGNSGPGADLSQRVPWSSQIPANHIYTYSVQNFIQGDEWTTATKSL